MGGLRCPPSSGPTLMNPNGAQSCPFPAHSDPRHLKLLPHLSAGPLMNSMESSASSTQGMMSAPRTPAAAAQGVLL